jgi:hypothetical protein
LHPRASPLACGLLCLLALLCRCEFDRSNRFVLVEILRLGYS